MNRIAILAPLMAMLAWSHFASAGTLIGHLRDPNWYARRNTNDSFGVGYYEFAVNGNGTNLSSLGAATSTDVFGAFTNVASLPTGSYTVASWDVWWRSAYAFNVPLPISGSTADVDLRLKATMWGYPAFWDDTSYFEFGQTFIATGPISMIYLRNPLNPGPNHTVTIHEGGPGGSQIGVSRSFNSYWDVRLIYGYGEMPTVAGGTYYLRIVTSGSRGVICQMDPRPDFSDPMPGGNLWLGDLTANPIPYRDRDLGMTIMSDDDGLITDLYTRPGGGSVSAVTNVGQTFIARGVSLISAAFWLADGTFPTYVVRVFQTGPGGAQVGSTKRGKPARPTADPEMLVLWAPGECPLTPGQTYYIEVSKDGGGVFNSVYVASGNAFPYGQAYTNGVARSGNDLAGTIMEEESPGSAARPAVQITADPFITEANRRTNQLTVQWSSDVVSDSLLEYAVEHPPYAQSLYSSNLVTSHSLTVTGLQSHTLYHFRVTSSRANYRAAISRDFVICTRPAASNLLTNPGFEEGTGPSPRTVIPGWNFPGGDVKTSSGTNHFFSLPPYIGNWFLQYSVNGGSSSNYIYQRVTNITPGREYTFSAWVRTDPRENSNWKYDEWDERGRLIHMRLGIDPTGGTNVNASSVRWTPRMYSHRHYTQLAIIGTPQSSNLTVFIRMQGEGVQWHLYSVDDCALTAEEIPVRLGASSISNNVFQTTVFSRANRTNVIEASTTLTNWFAVANFLNRTGAAPFTSTISLNRRFFRARQQ